MALLHNTDCSQPGRWTAPQLIAMLEGRWAQENAFKAMMEHVDIDWTNGYAHESCAQTPVPNPEARRLRTRLSERTAQLRRAMNKPTPRRPDAAARQRRRLGTLRGQVTRLTRRLAQVPTTVAYGSLGRRATSQLQPGRGLLFPVLRAAAYHLRLQLHDHIAAVFPDYREQAKALRALLKTPDRYVHSADADWIIFQRPHLPRYAAAMHAVVIIINANPTSARQMSRSLNMVQPSARGVMIHLAFDHDGPHVLADRESETLATRLIEETCRKEGIRPGQLTLHADRGAPMEPARDVPGEDIDDHAQAVEVPPSRPGELGNVPRPQLSGPRRQ